MKWVETQESTFNSFLSPRSTRCSVILDGDEVEFNCTPLILIWMLDQNTKQDGPRIRGRLGPVAPPHALQRTVSGCAGKNRGS